MKSPTLSIAKKEFLSFLNQPTGYILIIPFLLISYFLFLRNVLLIQEATLRPFFELLPWFLLILAPAVTMKSLAEEQRLGTLETLLSSPINEIQIVIGKFLGNFTFLLLTLAVTLSLPISLLIFSNPDPGIFLAQYLSSIFLAAAFTATGLTASSLSSNQVSAFLASIAINFSLILVSLEVVSLSLPSPLNYIANQLGILTHTQSLSRGLIDLRDLAYFIALTTTFLAIAVTRLLQRKSIESRQLQTQTHIGLGLIILIGIVANLLLQSTPIRIDLTANRQFTLSQATKNYLNQLPDLVTIKLFSSPTLPAPMQLVARDTQDLLKDYQRFAHGNIQILNLHPDSDPDAANQAQQLGIAPVQFNTLGAQKFEVQQGYLGIAIQYADQSEVIPFVDHTSNLEYRLTRLISKLTSESQAALAFLTGNQELSPFSELTLLQSELETQYQTTTVSLDTPDADTSFDLLAIAGPKSPLSATTSANISNYLNQGGKALILADGVSVNPQYQSATANQAGLDSLLSNYGLTLNQDLAYDLELNNTVQLSDQYRIYFLPYPFWPKTLPNQEFPPLADISSISLAWPSSINFEGNEQLTGQPLLTTSASGGSQTGTLSISPDQDLTPQGEQTLAYAVTHNQNSSRLILIGDSEFATDQMIQSHPENLAFLTNSIDWLVDNQDLSGISSKPQSTSLLQFTNPTQPLIFRFGNLIGIPLLVAAYGAYRLYHRRKSTQANS